MGNMPDTVAIHNKNGQGLLLMGFPTSYKMPKRSQSTIKMDKGYYKLFSINLIIFF